jgi:hypothetical protein
MRKHEAMAKQTGLSSMKARAQLLMDRELQNAKEKYPWMKEKLQQEASMFMNSNPTLSMLGMMDAAANAENFEAEASQSWIDGIKDQAYNPVSENGLGIDPRIEFGTETFARHYDAAMKLRSKQQSNQLRERFHQSNDTAKVRDAEAIVWEDLEGPDGKLRIVYDEVSGYLRELSVFQGQYRRDEITESQFLDYQDEWNRDGGAKVRQLLSDAKIGIRQSVTDNFHGSLADEPEAKAWMERANLHLEDLETIEQAFEAGNENIGEIVKTFSILRVQRLMEKAPHLRQFSDLATAKPETVAFWARQPSFASKYNTHLINAGINPEIMESMLPAVTAAYLQSHDADSIEEMARRRRFGNRESVGKGSRATVEVTNEEASIDNLAFATEIADKISTSELITGDPLRGQQALAAYTGILQGLGGRVEQSDWDQEDKIHLRRQTARPAWKNVIDMAGRDSKFVKDWVSRMQLDYFNKLDRPEEQVEAIAEASNQTFKVGNEEFSIMRLLVVDADQLDTKGVIDIQVNQGAINAYYQLPNTEDGNATELTAEHGRGQTYTQTVLDRREAANRAATEAQEYMEEHINHYIQLIALYNYAKNPNQPAPDYDTAWKVPFGNSNTTFNHIFTIEE